MTDGELLERGAAARVFQDSVVYRSVTSELVAEHTRAIVDSDFDDAEGRERHFRIIRALQLLDAELTSRALIAASVAKRQEDQQQDIEED